MFKYKIKRIIRIIDGDTIIADIDLGLNVILKNQKIRFALLDAPETSHRRKSRKVSELEIKAGKLVKKFVVEILKTHIEDCFLESLEWDKYGRIIGKISFKTVKLNEYLLEKGYCVRYGEKFTKTQLKTIIKELENVV